VQATSIGITNLCRIYTIPCQRERPMKTRLPSKMQMSEPSRMETCQLTLLNLEKLLGIRPLSVNVVLLQQLQRKLQKVATHPWSVSFFHATFALIGAGYGVEVAKLDSVIVMCTIMCKLRSTKEMQQRKVLVLDLLLTRRQAKQSSEKLIQPPMVRLMPPHCQLRTNRIYLFAPKCTHHWMSLVTIIS